jgi:hypothetical protein
MTDTTENEIEIETVDDPEEIVQSRRLGDVFDARKTVRAHRLEAKQNAILAEKSKQISDATRMYRAAVENYLSELRPLFLSDDLGKHYWFQLDLGAMVIEPQYYRGTIGDSSETLKYDYGDKTYRLREKPEPIEIDLTGLQCLFEVEDPISVSFELTVERAGLGRGMTSKTVGEIRNIPFDKLDSILNTTNEYLAEKGIELEARQTDEWEI